MKIHLQIIMLSSVRLLSRQFKIILKTNFQQIPNLTIKTIFKLLEIKNLITSILLCILIKKIYNKINFCILIKMRKIKIFLKCKINIRINSMLKVNMIISLLTLKVKLLYDFFSNTLWKYLSMYLLQLLEDLTFFSFKLFHYK